MTWNDAGLGAGQFAGAVKHVVMTDAGDFDLDENVAGTRLRRRKIANLQVLSGGPNASMTTAFIAKSDHCQAGIRHVR